MTARLFRFCKPYDGPPDNGVRLWGFGLNDGPSNGADYLDKFEILETTPKGVELPLCAYNGAGNPIPVED